MGTNSTIDDRIDLPTDFAEHLAAVSNLDAPPETLAEYWSVFVDQMETSDHEITTADLYTADPTRHEVRVDGRIQYSPCVLDALSAAVMEAQDPVTVRSVDPVTGTPVTFTVEGDTLDVTPEDAVITFGIASSISGLESSDESIFEWTMEAETESVTDAFCRHINAFEDAETYEQWAATAEGETVPIRPESAGALIRRYVDRD